MKLFLMHNDNIGYVDNENPIGFLDCFAKVMNLYRTPIHKANDELFWGIEDQNNKIDEIYITLGHSDNKIEEAISLIYYLRNKYLKSKITICQEGSYKDFLDWHPNLQIMFTELFADNKVQEFWAHFYFSANCFANLIGKEKIFPIFYSCDNIDLLKKLRIPLEEKQLINANKMKKIIISGNINSAYRGIIPLCQLKEMNFIFIFPTTGRMKKPDEMLFVTDFAKKYGNDVIYLPRLDKLTYMRIMAECWLAIDCLSSDELGAGNFATEAAILGIPFFTNPYSIWGGIMPYMANMWPLKNFIEQMNNEQEYNNFIKSADMNLYRFDYKNFKNRIGV